MNPFRLKVCQAFCLCAAWSALAANGIHSARMRAETLFTSRTAASATACPPMSSALTSVKV